MKRAVVCMLFAFYAATAALADGFIVPVEPRPTPEPIRTNAFYNVIFHRVKISIVDQVATTTVDQEFENTLNRRMEVKYLFPIPTKAVVKSFEVIVDGRRLTGRIVPADEARSIYERYVRQHRDPAILEYLGKGLFQTAAFPLPAKGKLRMQLTYNELLRSDFGLVEMIYPLSTEKYSTRPLWQVSLDVNISTSRGTIRNVYSPSHAITVKYASDRQAFASFEQTGVRPDTDFQLFYSVTEADVGATVLSYRPSPKQDGYFLMMFSPRYKLSTDEIEPKNIWFVFDRSGSMAGRKIQQTKAAMSYMLNSLDKRDKFNIISYSSVIEPFSPSLTEATQQAVTKALAFVKSQNAAGGTNIYDALSTALRQANNTADGRPNIIIFLTDGLPTSGIIDIDRIIADMTKLNEAGARLFVFGVGYDVNTKLLDRLGADNRGLSEYIRPGEDVEQKISALYVKVQHPVLTDLHLDYGRLKVTEQFPSKIPDLFKGGQVVLCGRYKQGGEFTIKLTGAAGKVSRGFEYRITLPEKTDRPEMAFVGRLWAARKIAHLLDEIRLHGKSDELIKQVVALARRWGIVTEYTSFLADDETVIADAAGNFGRARHELRGRIGVQTGGAGVNQALNLQFLRRSAAAPGQKMAGMGGATRGQGFYDARGRYVTVSRIRYIGSKTFYIKKGELIDAELDKDPKFVEVIQFSDEYFKLAAVANNALYLSQPMPVKVLLQGVAYHIVPAGKS